MDSSITLIQTILETSMSYGKAYFATNAIFSAGAETLEVNMAVNSYLFFWHSTNRMTWSGNAMATSRIRLTAKQII